MKEELKEPCSLIWGNLAVPKVQATAWRVFSHRIATRMELKRRGVLRGRMDDLCPLCKNSAESTQHLFLECSISATLWNGCLHWIGIQAPMRNCLAGNLIHFCALGRKMYHRLLLASLWSCIIWRIWKARNDIVFNNGEWRHDRMLGEIKAHLWNWAGVKVGLLKSPRNFHNWCKSPWDSLTR